MGVGTRNAIVFFGLILGIQTVITLFAPLRFYLLRSRKRYALLLWSDAFFTFGWVVGMVQGWYSIPVFVWDEIQVRRRASSELEVILHFATEYTGKIFFANFLVTTTTLWAYKMAFVFMYADLYTRTVNIRKQALHFTAAFVPLSFLVLVAVAFLECRPLSLAWDVGRLLQTGHFCSPVFSRRVQIITIVLNITTDLLLIALPLHIIRSLRLTTPEKRGLAFIFGIAALSVSAAVARFVVLNRRGVYDVNGRERIDFDKYYWTVVLAFFEIAAAEVAFVMPALRRVLLDRMRGKRRDETKEVMLVRVVDVEGQEEVVVDRADRDAAVWGFSR